MDHHPTTDVDPEQLHQAENFWRGFIGTAKVGIAAIALLLVVLALIAL